MSVVSRVAKAPLLGAIALYRVTLSPLVGANCRHLPTCSDYAREAIDKKLRPIFDGGLGRPEET